MKDKTPHNPQSGSDKNRDNDAARGKQQQEKNKSGTNPNSPNGGDRR
jgi:hypothetical protein